MRGSRLHRRLERDALHPCVAGAQQLVRAVLNPAGDVRIGRAAIGRVVLEAAVLGWIVRRRNHDAVGKMLFASAVVNQNGVRNGWRGRVAVVRLNDSFNAVGREHFQGGTLRRTGNRMRVLAHIKGTIDTLLLAVLANCLRDGKDVRFGEAAILGRAAMATGAEGDHLRGIANVGLALVVFALQTRDIDQHVLGRRLTRQRRDALALLRCFGHFSVLCPLF